MKILYIATQYTFKNNSAAIRNNSLVKGLVELGNDVDVYTLDSGHYKSDFFVREANGNINEQSISILQSNIGASVKQITNNKYTAAFIQFLKQFVFFPDMYKEWINRFDYNAILDTQYDLIISSSDNKTSHFIAHRIKKSRKDTPWIQIWGDPWSYDLNTSLFLRPITLFYEQKLLKAAEKIVYVSKLSTDVMKKKFPKYKSKMHFVSRGYYSAIEADNNKRDNIIIAYTGNLFYGRDISHFAEKIDELNRSYTKRIEIHIYGKNSSELSSYDCIVNHNAVDFDQIKDCYSSSDYLLFLSNAGDNTTQIPGKLFDYCGCTQPILCLCTSHQNKLIHYLSTIKKCVIMRNNEDITDTLNKIYNNNIPMTYCGVAEEYSPSNIAREVLSLIL